MAKQYLAFAEVNARNLSPVSGYMFLAITGDLTPEFDATDKPRNDYRGQDSAMGPTAVYRTEQKWNYKLKTPWYPGKETALLWKHALGNASARTVIDVSAYKGLITPHAMPFGSGPLGDKAICIIPNTDEQGVTKSQVYGGGRVTAVKASAKGSDDIELEFTIEGSWVGPADQAAIGGVSFPAADPFNSSQYRAFIGGVPVRTGVVPSYTDLAPGTAVAFKPDSLDITITNGLKDKTVGDGVRGPNKTTRSAAFKYEVACPTDYEDPGAGAFSSAAEFKSLFTGPKTNNLMVVFDNGELAGAATQNYTAVLDLPLMMLKNPKKADRNPDGKTAGMKLAYESMNSIGVGYPLALQLVDGAITI